MNKKFTLLLLLFSGFFIQLNAQKVITGQSAVQYFQMKATYTRGLPPNLYAELQFNDENGNGILEANEKAELKLIITNRGKGVAQDLKISVENESVKDPELSILGNKRVSLLAPNQSVELNIPIEAGFNIKSAEHKLKINVLEYFGYDMDPAYLVMNTLEYQSPKIAFSGYEVVDYGAGTAAIKQDGKIQPGELVKVKVYIQNIGQNVAKDIKYGVYSKDPNIFIDRGTGTLDELAIGEVNSFWVSLSPNKRISSTGKLPIYLDVTVEKGRGNLFGKDLDIALNQTSPQTEILSVKPDIEKIRKQVARFEYSSNKFTANIGSAINIREVPSSGMKRNNAVAVVFGIEKYDDLPPAPYAENDARIIKEYLTDVLGFEKVVTYTSDAARGLVFDDVFNPDYGDLQKAIVKGETDLFVFYSGHGIPSKSGEKVYLFPSDGKVARLDLQGYDLNKLYKNLEKLEARSTTVFLDACFSGSSKKSEKVQTENLVAMKGIRVKPKLIQPWATDPNFSVFTSSSLNETSLAFDASQNGLFTYFVCAGLKGEADLNADKTITMGELYRYVNKEVMNTSKKISGLQTPEFHGNPNTILVKF